MKLNIDWPLLSLATFNYDKRKTQTATYASWLTTSHNTLGKKSASYTDFSTCVI